MKNYEITINDTPNSGRQPVSVNGHTRHLPIGKKVTVTEAELEVLTHANIGVSVWGEAGKVEELPEEPEGQSAEAEEAGIENPIEEREEEQAAEQPEVEAPEVHPLDHDADGEKGGSLSKEPPALTGMTKDELEAQAELETVDLTAIEGTGANGNVLAKDIREAIEANRQAKG